MNISTASYHYQFAPVRLGKPQLYLKLILDQPTSQGPGPLGAETAPSPSQPFDKVLMHVGILLIQIRAL